MKRLLALLTLVTLAGCAVAPQPLPEHRIEVAATPRQALDAGLHALVARGFVIRLADADLGRLDAVLASRPGYVVRYEVDDVAGGTRVSVSGRHGGRAIDPQRFAPLLAEVTARLEPSR